VFWVSAGTLFTVNGASVPNPLEIGFTPSEELAL
jgi:hypothetical protein